MTCIYCKLHWPATRRWRLATWQNRLTAQAAAWRWLRSATWRNWLTTRRSRPTADWRLATAWLRLTADRYRLR